MKRLALALVVCLLTLGGSAWGMQKWTGFCQQGGQKVSISGLGQSTTKWMQSYPGCTVTVYDSGTSNLSTIYSDDGVTPKANPFTADSTTGLAFFFAGNGVYDIQFSGTSMTTYTLGAIQLLDLTAPWNPVNITGGTIDGTTIGGTTPAAGTFTTLSCTSFESLRCAPAYASGSNTGGIAEAYAAGPSTGVGVILGADITISSAQTITLTAGKPLWLVGNNRTITCTHTSGACLWFLKSDTTPRYEIELDAFTMKYAGASSNVVGIKLGNGGTSAITDVGMRNVTIDNFSTSGAVALELSNCEDCRFYTLKLNQNTLHIKIDKDSNNNQFFGVNMQGGSQCVSIVDASGNNFIGGLCQATTGQHTFTIATSTQAIVGNTIQNMWLEGNGDTTSASRVFYLTATSPFNIFTFASINNTINAGVGGASGKVYDFNGTGLTISPSMAGNSYGGYPGVNVETGTSVYPISVQSESPAWADFGWNLSGVGGSYWWPLTGHKYHAWAGDTNQGDANNWNLDSDTSSVRMLHWSDSSKCWSGYSDNASTLQWTICNGTGGALFKGGVDLNSIGILNTGPIAGATTVAMGGALTGATTISMSGALSGVTSISMSAGLTGMTTLSMSGQLTNTLTTGTAPLVVSSTTVNTNLNADLLDGFHAGNASTGHAMCWKDATHMGYCSTTVDASGLCTCN